MRRLRFVGLVLGASLLVGSSAASAQTDDDEATAAAAITDGLCYSQQFTDPDEAADELLDVSSYEIGFDCYTQDFVVGVTTVDSWADDMLNTYKIDIDTTANLDDGCFGIEYSVSLGRGDLNGMLTRIEADCSVTVLSSTHIERPADNQLSVSFPSAPFKDVPAFRWQQALYDVHVAGDGETDYMPDGSIWAGAYHTTPGDLCVESCFYLSNRTTGGSAEVVFRDPELTSQILIGDWNADSVDSFGFRSGNTYKLKNAHAPTAPDRTFSYGRSTDTVLVGDWNGDGVDTLAVRRGNTYYIRNSFGSGAAEITVAYGRATDTVLVGDWNGDGIDTLAVRRGNTYFIKNSFSSGNADITVAYGRATDTVLVGDWNGDNVDTLGVRRGYTYYLKNSFSSGNADIAFTHGWATDVTFVGDWNADGLDTIGLRR